MFCIIYISHAESSLKMVLVKKHLEKLTTSFAKEFDGLFNGGSR